MANPNLIDVSPPQSVNDSDLVGIGGQDWRGSTLSASDIRKFTLLPNYPLVLFKPLCYFICAILFICEGYISSYYIDLQARFIGFELLVVKMASLLAVQRLFSMKIQKKLVSC